MKLHRIALTDYRGVEASEVAFDAPGITVVVGPNEIGKSSLAEALRLIRAFKDSSRHREIMAVKPTHRDVGPQVEIEVETGAYRFVYTKRWLKKPSTELRITAPAAEQLTGDEAHERVEQIFASTLDPDLWSALQQVQGESLQQASLARVSPLQAALSAQSESGEVDDTHADLMGRIDAEYRRYFTRTGSPTGEHASSARDLAALRELVDAARASLRDVADGVERHERLTLQRVGFAERTARAVQELAALQERHQSVATLRQEHEQASGRLREAVLASEAAQAALGAREERATTAEQLRAKADAAAATVTEATRRHTDTVAALADFDQKRKSGREQLDAARAEVADAGEAVESSRAAADLGAARERLERADNASARLVAAEEAIHAHSVDDDLLRELSDAHAQLQAMRAAATSGAARVTVERLGDAAVTIDGESIDLTATMGVTRELQVVVPDVVRVVVVPDDAAALRLDEVERVEQGLAESLRAAGVADLAAARAAAAARREAIADGDRALIERDAALAEQSRESLHGTIAGLAAKVGDAEAGDADVLAEALQAAREALGAAEAAAEDEAARREMLLAQDKLASDQLIKAAVSAESIEDEAARAEARLANDRATVSDDDLTSSAGAAVASSEAATGLVTATQQALVAQGADQLQVELDNALPLRDRTAAELVACDRDLATVEAELEVRGRDGLQDRLDEALGALDDAERRHSSLAARAAAAQLLHETMSAHQAAAQQRYVAPFKASIERLGAVVFGQGFEVEIGDDLSIVSRTVDHVTVPFESLSGGAREQLAVIGRLATAQLVSSDDGAPVILDDSLGFSDAPRRARLAAVLNMVGASAQIIILTCEPERFSGIGNAVTVPLG